jgi:predicted nucleic acid-binding protein
VIVIDASALLDVLLRVPDAEAVEARFFAQDLHAPHLIDIEVAQVLRRHAAAGWIEQDRGRQALADLADFPIRRYPHSVFLEDVWDLRHNFTAYDAIYVAVAEALDAPLLTRDRRLAAAATSHVRVEIV